MVLRKKQQIRTIKNECMPTHSTRQDTKELGARDLLSSCSLHLDVCIIFHF